MMNRETGFISVFLCFFLDLNQNHLSTFLSVCPRFHVFFGHTSVLRSKTELYKANIEATLSCMSLSSNVPYHA